MKFVAKFFQILLDSLMILAAIAFVVLIFMRNLVELEGVKKEAREPLLQQVDKAKEQFVKEAPTPTPAETQMPEQ